jgi:hypothetical protein
VPDVWSTLGYDRIAAQIAQVLADGDDIAVVEGPPGVGKSWLAKAIGAMWEAGGGSTLVAEGDLLKSDAALYPFAFAMSGLGGAWKSLGPKVAGVARPDRLLQAGHALLLTAAHALDPARST